ncbi:hypothetical protein PMAYCL1PPCAC_25209 [Pristionchus mayeri]|uniref:BTB domain-containing protein n=1 Tax=Pristionchus mayeri TaxID=1317129 RepID=A0AAN5D3M1_9BILA|nr:hypothetical protein PMAYCL1PPCAC_25209 [Pristionchus mayeri]
MKTTQPDGVIRIEIAKVSELDLKGCIGKSPETFVKGVPWYATAWTCFPLHACLNCGLDQLVPWTVDVDTEFVLPHPDSTKHLTVEESFHFTKRNCEHGSTILRRDENFIRKLKEFSTDDKITIEIRLWLSNMKGIRCLPHIDFTDPNDPRHNLTLVMEGGKVYVNKGILAFHSCVFNVMFYGDFAEKNKTEIELKDVDREEFIELLHVIYHSNRKITFASAEFLLKLSDQFQIESVIDRIENYLINDCLRLSKAMILRLADQYRLSAVKEERLSKITFVSTFEAIEKDPVYNDLSDEMKAAILERKVAVMERESSSDDSSDSDWRD